MDVRLFGASRERLRRRVHRGRVSSLSMSRSQSVGEFLVAEEVEERASFRHRVVEHSLPIEGAPQTETRRPRDRARAESSGFDAHLVKPIEPPLLALTFESVMRETIA